MTRVFGPGSTIGIIGNGQLGRMSAMAAARLGYHAHIFSPSPSGPACEVAARTTVGAYDDPESLLNFAERCDVVTFEFENISAEGLEILASRCPVRPCGDLLRISQDRALEKAALEKMGLDIAPWRKVDGPDDLSALEEFGFPLILKTCRFGYDGKGQFRIADRTQLDALKVRGELPYPLVAERVISFAREISVMVARGVTGETRCFDPTENRHGDGILRLSLAPARIMPDLALKAQEMARFIAETLDLVGVMGVEMFHTEDGGLLVNEIAPRPHNSGHWTMDACPADQFEMHIRAVTGLPLPPARRHSDAMMRNLIGPEDMKAVPSLLADEGACLHLYGKEEARPGRKMGHATWIFPHGGLPGELALEELGVSAEKSPE